MTQTVEQLIVSLEKVANKQRTVVLCVTDFRGLEVAGVLDTGEDDDCVELFLDSEAESELTGGEGIDTVEFGNFYRATK